jgi:hypothetical protein
MYQAKIYQTMDREKIAAAVRTEGFDPIYISDPPGRTYQPHRHPETKLLVFLEGSMACWFLSGSLECRMQ